MMTLTVTELLLLQPPGQTNDPNAILCQIHSSDCKMLIVISIQKISQSFCLTVYTCKLQYQKTQKFSKVIKQTHTVLCLISVAR